MNAFSKNAAAALLATTILSSPYMGMHAPALAQTYSAQVGGNMLINPWMEIDQVNEGTVGTAGTTQTGVAAGTYTIHKRGDGWYTTDTVNTTVSITAVFQNAAVSPTGSITDMLYTVSTASATAADGTIETIEQRVEASKLAALQYGTANAQPSYLQFCGKASIAGNYSFYILGGTSALTSSIHTTGSSYFQTFNVPVAAQWNCYNFVIPGDTAGTWLVNTPVVDTTHGATLGFVMGANGTSTDKYTGTACVSGVWANGVQNCVAPNTGQVLMSKTAGATFELTSVKWALDNQPLVHAPGFELMEAQRYFNKTVSAGVGGTAGFVLAVGVNPCGAVSQCPAGKQPATGIAEVAAASSGITYVYPVPMAIAPTVSVNSPFATTTTCVDMVTTASVVTSTIEPNAASHTIPGSLRQVYVSCAASVNAAGDQVGIHITADGRL